MAAELPKPHEDDEHVGVVPQDGALRHVPTQSRQQRREVNFFFFFFYIDHIMHKNDNDKKKTTFGLYFFPPCVPARNSAFLTDSTAPAPHTPSSQAETPGGARSPCCSWFASE